MNARWLFTAVALMLAVSFSLPAQAQRPKAERAEAAAAPSTDPKVFDFEGDMISEKFLRPDAGMVGGIVREKRKSLIKIRMDFVDEIVRSAEDL